MQTIFSYYAFHTDVAHWLVDMGSNINALDYRYDSPLHLGDNNCKSCFTI